MVALDVVEHIECAGEHGEMRIDIFDQFRRNLLAELLEHGAFFIKRLKRAGDDWRWPV